MYTCRFENNLNGTAIALSDPRERVSVDRREDLPGAFAAIEECRARGLWVALMLEYELGEWLVPGFPSTAETVASKPRLNALAFGKCTREKAWEGQSESRFTASAIKLPIELGDYVDNVWRIQRDIKAGNFYQVNYTFPIDFHVDGHPKDIYRFLSTRHRTSYSAFVQDENRYILSFSPELFLRRKGQHSDDSTDEGYRTAPRGSRD